MNIRVKYLRWVFPAIVAGAVACSSNPAQPSNTVTAPGPVQPANNAQVQNSAQPLTLAVQNAAVSKASVTTYTFEVATDSAFASKVQTKDGVTEGTGGQTSVKLDALPASSDYYWHARATAGGTAGPFGTTYKFRIGPPINLNAPAAIGPMNGAQTGPQPTFRVTNAGRAGPTGAITYKFEIDTASAFTSIIVTGTSAEGGSETSYTPSSDLPVNATLYWRATAIDAANGVTSTPSAVQSFTPMPPSQASLVAAQEGVPLWPGVQPGGTTGHAVMGNFWNVVTISSFNGFTFLTPPLDQVQIFDLLDRGMDPEAAINWMHANGYATQAAYYASVQVIGFTYEYMALINGRWDNVRKVGA
jgi:hypothetical protein